MKARSASRKHSTRIDRTAHVHMHQHPWRASPLTLFPPCVGFFPLLVQLPGLQKLYERGQANSVADLSMVSGSTVSELEPAVVGAAGLLSPHTGVACFPLVARSYARELQQRGGEIRTNFELVRAVQIDSSSMAAAVR